MNDRITIELEWQQIDSIVIGELKSIANSCQESIDAYHSGSGDYLCFFANNPAEDVEILKKHVDAAKLLLEYYGYFYPEVAEYMINDEEESNEQDPGT